jgi:hypothetical protein
MTSYQVAEIRIVVREVAADASPAQFEADTFVGRDALHFEHDGHCAATLRESANAGAAWALSRLSGPA